MERAFGVFDMCMAVESAGYNYKCAGELPLKTDELFPDGACVVLNGAAGRVAEINRKRGWLPNGWCEPEVFACKTYYEFWTRHIVQERFTFLPFGSLLGQQSDLFESMAIGNKVFIRPDSFDKSFDGVLVERNDFERWLRRTSAGTTNDSTLCVVSQPRLINDEWRLILRDRRVIAGSSYRIGGRIIKTETPPSDVIQFAESVASDPYPGLPNIYVMDTCAVGDRFAVVEVGSINACGFYGCDLSVVIPAISDEAEDQWRTMR